MKQQPCERGESRIELVIEGVKYSRNCKNKEDLIQTLNDIWSSVHYSDDLLSAKLNLCEHSRALEVEYLGENK